MATDASAGPDVTAFERIGAPNVPYPPYNQLDMQIAGLRAQLMVAEEQLRRTRTCSGGRGEREPRAGRGSGSGRAATARTARAASAFNPPGI
jgi:hypothetical protein